MLLCRQNVREYNEDYPRLSWRFHESLDSFQINLSAFGISRMLLAIVCATVAFLFILSGN
jgi:hypothetical protein